MWIAQSERTVCDKAITHAKAQSKMLWTKCCIAKWSSVCAQPTCRELFVLKKSTRGRRKITSKSIVTDSTEHFCILLLCHIKPYQPKICLTVDFNLTENNFVIWGLSKRFYYSYTGFGTRVSTSNAYSRYRYKGQSIGGIENRLISICLLYK